MPETDAALSGQLLTQEIHNESRLSLMMSEARRRLCALTLATAGAVGTGSTIAANLGNPDHANAATTEQIQPKWAQSPTDRVIATEWACSAPEQYPNFDCPVPIKKHIGALLFKYDSNGGRESQAMLYIPKSMILEQSQGKKITPRPLAVYLHGRGPENTTDENYRSYWASGLYPTPAGKTGYVDAMYWAANRYNMVIVAPEGQGRVIKGRSWGYPDHIKDISTMREKVKKTLPYITMDPRRVYAFGSSMGGHESLQAVAMYPTIFAAAYSDDGVSSMTYRYFEMKNGMKRSGRYAPHSMSKVDSGLLYSMTKEVGGTPDNNPRAYQERSPLVWLARHPAAACLRPTYVGVNTADSIVPNLQSERYITLHRKVCGPTKHKNNLKAVYTRGGHSAQTQRRSGYVTPMSFFRYGNKGSWQYLKNPQALRR